MVRYGMVIDTRKCAGCMSCTVACKSENNVPLGVFRAWVKQVQKGEYPNASRHNLPRLCNQCDNAPCVTVCPTKASHYRPDGIVAIDYEKCIGCKYCMQACPYNARFINPIRKTAEKCNYCEHRVDEGLKPACVTTCIGNARTFGDLDDPDSEISKLITKNAVRVLKPEMGTKPKTMYIGADDVVMGRLDIPIERYRASMVPPLLKEGE
jgi:tetrathionate reductase subunit B